MNATIKFSIKMNAEVRRLLADGYTIKYGSARGYIGVTNKRNADNIADVKIVTYSGKYGEGYKILVPNLLSSFHGRVSNNYYQVQYFVKNN